MKSWLTFLTIALLATGAQAQETRIVPESREQINFSYAPVVKKVAPAVVNIYTKSRVTVMQNASPFANDPFFQQFFGQGFQFGGVPHEQIVSSLGSGVLIKADGTIVTSHHVIKDAQEIRVVLADKREFDAKIILKDPGSDLAFLKIDAKQPLPFLDMRDSDSLEVGDLVLAIGNPFGVGQTVTNGIVSGLARKAVGVSDYQFFIQTDAAINPGNSGGALVDMQGRLIGVNTAIYSTSGGSTGIGFAIPANMVRSLMGGKVEGGRVVHAWIGASVQPVTPEIAESMGLKSLQGVLVKGTYPGSPAEKAGIKVGDVITAVDGTEIGNEQDLQYRMALSKIGGTAKFQIMRNGNAQDINVELIAPPETTSRDEHKLSGHNPFNGIAVANLSPALAVQLGMDDSALGVVVTAVNASTTGLNVGFHPGDVITSVNGTKITSAAQLEKIIKAGGHNWQVTYQRGGNLMNLTVQM